MVGALYLRNNHLNEFFKACQDCRLCRQYWILKQCFFLTDFWHICSRKMLLGKIMCIYQDNLEFA